ncbi:Protein NRT1/ PTR FAMILY 7.1 [Striga hermonthica]|uniref:Protein NRT1/ PTR FAMILY 7.1 n=1 Tax=Striga hermonthica TaxID=68872 RepID=A0A9N7P1Q3_STRHE|nr:Protein NRT1/ PTR FAMILY 7.1 [Striga hermonthica]
MYRRVCFHVAAIHDRLNVEGAESPKAQEAGHVNIIVNIPSLTRKESGGWGSAFLLLANQGLATLAFFGVGVNLVLFFTRVLGQDNASAANNVSKWTGTVYLCSLVGAFLSDSYWGRYLTCAIFQVIFVAGLVLLSVSSQLLLLKPAGCGDSKKICVPTSPYASALFYLAIYLVALGYGGHQPTLATLGSDQFDESQPRQKKSKAVFFSYFYFALNLGSLFSNTVLVYYENVGRWNLGFWAATASAVLALAAYLAGSPGYRYMKPSGNPVTRVMQVFVAAVKKCNVVKGDGDELYEVDGLKSAIKGSRKICHTREFGWLDKAATITGSDRVVSPDPWRLCTVTQVEEAKCILRMLPIWLCTIPYSVVFTQMASLFVEQGDLMNTRLPGTHFRIPAASMTAFDILSVLAFTGIYRRFISRLHPTELQRMAAGLVVAALAVAAAGALEVVRLRAATPVSILWQVPQYVLVGASEVLMYVGQLDFFNGQAPDGVKSLGSSLCMASISLGNFANSLLVSLVTVVTTRGGGLGWIPQDLNKGHLDRFYFLVAGLTAVDFLIYLVCARWYGSKEAAAEEEGDGDGGGGGDGGQVEGQ